MWGLLLVYNLYEYISGKRGCMREYSEWEQAGAFGDSGVYNSRILLYSYRLFNNTKERLLLSILSFCLSLALYYYQ